MLRCQIPEVVGRGRAHDRMGVGCGECRLYVVGWTGQCDRPDVLAAGADYDSVGDPRCSTRSSGWVMAARIRRSPCDREAGVAPGVKTACKQNSSAGRASDRAWAGS